MNFARDTATHIRQDWLHQAANNAVLAMQRHASVEDVLLEIGMAGKVRRRKGADVKDISLGWLRSTTASAAASGASKDDVRHAVFVAACRRELLSEGQCCKALNMDRIDFRRLCDEIDYV